MDMHKVTKKNLADTIPMMVSDDYRERFRAEFYQLHARYDSLCDMLSKWDSGKLNFTPVCDKFILRLQAKTMKEYLEVLVERADIEGIDISLVG